MQFGMIYRSVELLVPGDCVAGNRGADFVKRLAPALCAGTRHWTGHREPHIKLRLLARPTAPVSTAIMLACLI
jgi:hypothetical protein